VLRKEPLQKRALLGVVEAGQKRAVTKARPLQSARALSFARRNQKKSSRGWRTCRCKTARGVSLERHRFQAVESTSVVEQPSPFAGWRSVDSLGRCESKGARDFGLEDPRRKTRIPTQPTLPSGHSSLASDLAVMTGGARRAKEEGIATRHRRNLELVSNPATEGMSESSASGRPLQPSLGPLTRMSPSSPPRR